jgi:hypothetical protein
LIPSDWLEVARAIHGSGRRLVVTLTGGGSGVLAALLQTPGASRSVLEAAAPYSLAALVEWIGGKPDQACSERTARAMAMAGFMRALKLAPEADAATLVGIGCTASLATDRPKRGERRVHAAYQTADCTKSFSLALRPEKPTRSQDEEVAAKFVLSVIAEACGVATAPMQQILSVEHQAGGLVCDEVKAGSHQRALLMGHEKLLLLSPAGAVSHTIEFKRPTAVFPGAFNPVHAGHRRMAAHAEKRLGRPVAWELSIANVDKPPLDFIAVNKRVEALQVEHDGRLIAVTSAPTFVEKADLFPGATFVVGADTMLRIAEPRY